jgi:hypothetical protein
VLLLWALVLLSFTISIFFNIVPSWIEDYRLGLMQTALVVFMASALVSFEIKAPWRIRIVLVILAPFLFRLLVEGAGEQIGKARDAVADGSLAKMRRYDELDGIIKEKKRERDGYITSLSWHVGSPDTVAADKTALQNAETQRETLCKIAPTGTACSKATKAAKAAQATLTEDSNYLEWSNGRKRLDGEIPRLQNEQFNLHAPTGDPQKVAAARTADFWNKKVGWALGDLTEKEVTDGRPMNVAVAGEALSGIGPAAMIFLINHLFAALRAALFRK